LVGILYCKDTKSGIKIPGFHQRFSKQKMSFAFKKFSKNIFENIVDYSAFILSKWINIWLYFLQTQY